MTSQHLGFILTSEHWAQMQADVSSRFPEEACGVVIGLGNRASLIVPITNMLHDPYRFRMDPQEELDAFILAEKKGMEIVAVYHSHPHGISHPSQSDLSELAFSEMIYLIWYQDVDRWTCRGYRMHSTSADEIPVLVSTKE